MVITCFSWESPALQPPEVSIDQNTMAQIEKDRADALAMPLPEDDDEEL